MLAHIAIKTFDLVMALTGEVLVMPLTYQVCLCISFHLRSQLGLGLPRQL